MKREMAGEIAAMEAPPKQMSPKDLLAKLVEKYDQKAKAQSVLDDLTAEVDLLKEQVKYLFVEMGVNQMKVGKTVYLNRQIWAGTAENATNVEVVHALERLNLDSYVTYNHQSLSGYVREIAKQHKEWYDRDGHLLVDTDKIIAELPEPLNKLVKVTEKVDIKIKK